jgi:hypothetical protein
VIGAQAAPGTAGHQVGEHHVQSVDRLGLHQVITVIDDGAQRRGLGVGLGGVQRGGGKRGDTDRHRIGVVVCRPFPMDSGRTRVASFAGTSMT